MDAPRIRPIDGLRALSVIWMIAFHSFYFLGYFVPAEAFAGLLADPMLFAFQQGHLAVDVFFVISGFLIASLLLEEQESSGDISLTGFYLRRALRLLPAYLLVLALFGLTPAGRRNLPSIWANLAYINNFLPFNQQYMAWSWSLAIEEQFYLVFPVFLLACRRWSLRVLPVLAGLLAVCLVINGLIARALLDFPVPAHPTLDSAGYSAFFDLLYDKTYSRCGAILCGVIAACLSRRPAFMEALGRRPIARRAACLAAGAGALWYVCRPGMNGLDSLRIPGAADKLFLATQHYGFAALCGVVLLVVLADGRSPRPGPLSRFLSHRFWFPVAELSYGAFLLHPGVMLAGYAWLRPQEATVAAVLAYTGLFLTLTFAAAGLMYRFIEQPFRGFGRRYRTRVAAVGEIA